MVPGKCPDFLNREIWKIRKKKLNEKVYPYVCSCGKCEVELIWNHKKIRVTSPQVAAGIHRATRKFMRLEEYQVYLFASESKTRTSDKVRAIYDFHECANLLVFLEQFPSWLKAIQKVREELDEAYEKAKMINFYVKNWEGRRGELERSPETTIGELKDWMKDYFGRKSWVDSKKFRIGGRVVEDSEIIGDLGVKNGDVLRCC